MTVEIESGFARVGAGEWLVSHSQPVAFASALRRVARRGWAVRDRSALERISTGGEARCADSSRPFLTHIPCAAPINAVSAKVLIAPAAAWTGAEILRTIPMSVSGSLTISTFALPQATAAALESATSDKAATPPSPASWVVMATASRTTRWALEDGQTISVRPDALVAWTGKRPTGFCPRLGIMDVLLPRGPKDLLLNFYGPGIVWIEGTRPRMRRNAMRERRVF